MSRSSTESPHEGPPHFIGWLPMPATHRRFLIPIAAGRLLAVAGLAAAVAYSQRDPGNGRWETDSVRTFDGLVFAWPYAMLRVPGENPGDAPRTLLLVEEGKFGALARARRFTDGTKGGGQAVRVMGTLLHRDGRGMLELVDGEEGMRRLTGEEEARLPALGWPQAEVMGRVTLAGDIIDPKCYLGAMRPGSGKTHKSCAMLCVSGGVPPMLVRRDVENNRETFYLLTTQEGEAANALVLPFVGDRVTVTGQLERRGDLLTLLIDADSISRRLKIIGRQEGRKAGREHEPRFRDWSVGCDLRDRRRMSQQPRGSCRLQANPGSPVERPRASTTHRAPGKPRLAGLPVLSAHCRRHARPCLVVPLSGIDRSHPVLSRERGRPQRSRAPRRQHHG
jgi:hypothetical protein